MQIDSSTSAGLLAKVFRIHDAFGTTLGVWATAAVRTPIEMWVDATALAGRPVLCGFATGAHARRVESMKSEELCAMAYEVLSSVPEFGRW